MHGLTPQVTEAEVALLSTFPPAVVMEMVVRHRLTPWLRAALEPHRELVPSELWKAFELGAEFQISRTMAHYVGLLRILEWADENAIEIMVLKGPAVAHEWYPDPTLRPYSDIDLLVCEADVDALTTRLEETGHAEKFHDHAEPSHHEHGEFQRIFTHVKTGQIVEVHVNHLQIGLRPVGMRDIWERSRWMTFHDTRARALEAHDLFVHLAIHLHRHGFDRLIWFKDLDLMVRNGSLDWDRVIQLASEQGCRESLATTVELLAQTLGTPLPPAAKRLTATRSRFSRWLFDLVWHPADVIALAPRRRWRMRRAVQFAPETGILRGGVLALFFTGRRRDKFRVLFARLLRRKAS